MKVIIINSVVGSGSTGKIVEGIKKTLIQNNVSVKVLYGRRKRNSNDEDYYINNLFSFIFSLFLTRLFDLHGKGLIIPTLKAIIIIKKFKPDIVNIHNIHGYYINYRILMNYLNKKNYNVCWTLHDCWGYTGHCSYYDFVQCEKWKKHCYHCAIKNSYPKSFVFSNSKKNFFSKKKSFKENLILITPSIWLRNEIERSFLKNNEKVIINNGIDLDIFRPIKNIKNKYEKKIILGVANIWEERKGLKDFYGLAKEISEDYIIILIGVDENIKKMLPKNIIGINRTKNQEELAEYYSVSEIFFNPTYEDNFPTTNIEALACGTPVITYNTGGSPEVVGDCGLVIEKQEYNAIIEYMEKMSRMEMRQKCRERARKLYQDTERYEEYLSLFKEMMLNK